jgi:SAM-dependent methyltransferase
MMSLDPRIFALDGLHDFVLDAARSRLVLSNKDVLELGAGSGIFASRLQREGASVTAADIDDGTYARFSGASRFLTIDFNSPDFASRFETKYEAIFAIEVIEHLESPLGFLRNIRSLLTDDGVAFVTTPNVDNLPSRLLFVRAGQLRGASEHDDPGHISPIHTWILERRLLPRAGLALETTLRFPAQGFSPGPSWRRRLIVALGPLLAPHGLAGDINVFVIRTGP